MQSAISNQAKRGADKRRELQFAVGGLWPTGKKENAGTLDGFRLNTCASHDSSSAKHDQPPTPPAPTGHPASMLTDRWRWNGLGTGENTA